MIDIAAALSGIGLIGLALLALALQRFYSSVPAKELKRLAQRGDHLAAALYRPVAYGTSLRLLLWALFAGPFAGGVLLVTAGYASLLAFVVVGLAMAGIVLLASVRLTVRSARLAVYAAPVLNWLLTYTQLPLDVVARAANHFRAHTAHSGLYEKEDLVALIRQQKRQVDNRIAEHDLDLLERAAHFDERQAADIVLPMSRVKLVRQDEPIGPILLKELHDSGQRSFLVYADSPEQVVGTLFLRDAMQARQGGRVADLIHRKLAYVHEDFTLRQTFQAFAQTNQYMVVVINAFEEAVGVITLEQLLGELVGGNWESDLAYEDRGAVAAYKPAPATETGELSEDQAAEGAEATPDLAEEAVLVEPSSPEATEVVK